MRRRPLLVILALFLVLLLMGGIIRSHRQNSSRVDKFIQENSNQVGAQGSSVAGTLEKNITSGEHIYTFDTKDGERTYAVYVPKSYDGTKPLPVLIHLHGGLGTAESSDTSTSFSSYADERGFILVYGEGRKGRTGLTSWNAGGCCGASQEKRDNVDDVDYIKTVISQVQEKFRTDTKRVYVSGMSNGSMLANRLACEMPEILAGVATVSGTTQVSDCRPSQFISHVIIHGTADDNVPYYGGKSDSPLNNGTFIAVEDEFKDWARRNSCTGEVNEAVVSGKNTDGTSTDKLFYTNCPKGKEVVLYRVNGGKHAWPGGRAGTNALELSKSSESLVASKAILDFFGL